MRFTPGRIPKSAGTRSSRRRMASGSEWRRCAQVMRFDSDQVEAKSPILNFIESLLNPLVEDFFSSV
jgi:hypothetical protein